MKLNPLSAHNAVLHHSAMQRTSEAVMSFVMTMLIYIKDDFVAWWSVNQDCVNEYYVAWFQSSL